MSAEQFATGLAGYRFFGFEELAENLVGLENATDEGFEKLDELYCLHIPTDSTIDTAFKDKFSAQPELFAAVQS